MLVKTVPCGTTLAKTTRRRRRARLEPGNEERSRRRRRGAASFSVEGRKAVLVFGLSRTAAAHAHDAQVAN